MKQNVGQPAARWDRIALMVKTPANSAILPKTPPPPPQELKWQQCLVKGVTSCMSILNPGPQIRSANLMQRHPWRYYTGSRKGV